MQAEEALAISLKKGNDLKTTIDGISIKGDSGSAAAVANITDGANGVPMSLEFAINPAQSGSGTPAPDNVRAITGYTGITISHSGQDTNDPTEYEITFPTAAGTVYGGTLAINENGTGTLTVDTVYATIDGSTAIKGSNTAAYNGTDGTDRYVALGTTAFPTAKEVASGSYQNTAAILACDELEIKTAGIWASDTYNNVIALNATTQLHFRLSNTTTGIEITDDNDARTAAIKTWLASHPIHVTYKKATADTYTFTAAQIKSLLGENNVWANTGNTQITSYTEDPKLYIAAQLAALS